MERRQNHVLVPFKDCEKCVHCKYHGGFEGGSKGVFCTDWCFFGPVLVYSDGSKSATALEVRVKDGKEYIECHGDYTPIYLF